MPVQPSWVISSQVSVSKPSSESINSRALLVSDLSAQNSFADAFTIDCSSVKSIFKLLNSIFNPLVGLTHAHRQYLPGFDLFHHQLLSKSYLDKPVARTRFE